MNKYARQVLLIKTAQALQDPRVPQHVKQVAIDFAKHAGLFGSAMDFGSNMLSGIGDFTSGLGSGIGSAASSLGSSIMSGIGAMLPPGITWESVANSLKRSDPEIARLANQPHFMEALKQAVSETGQPINDILEALGLK